VKIIILHGEDSIKSFERLSKFIESAKKRGWEIITDEFPNTPSLFGNDRLIIYRDYKLLGKNDVKNFDRFDGTLVIYHEGILNQTFLKSLPKNTKIEEFKLPVILWNFLDGLYPENSVRSIKIFHQIIERDAPEFVITLMAKLFRDLYWVKTDPSTLPYPSWRVGKLKSQSSKFTIENLKLIIENLSDIDIKVKTSKADLVSELDLLIIKQLE
jgi:DNA polymerase III delta subunit